MTCNDCPNATDGKCCHQLIRPQGSKTMNLLDDRANDEADRHAQMMQEQRKPVGIIGAANARKEGLVIYAASAPLAWHKTGTEYEK